MGKEIVLSALEHTWILDLDGTIVKHNGYKLDGHDTFLDGAKEFLDSIPQNDMIIFLTSRAEEYRNQTEDFLKKNHVHYHYIIFEVPYGERILMNDKKPSGLNMAIALSGNRDEFCGYNIRVDHEK